MAAAAESPKLLVFDIETTDLEANRGHILSVAYKWVGDKDVQVQRIDNNKGYGKSPSSYFSDGAIIAPFIAEARKADALIAYYGGYGKFDVPYVNTRAIVNGLKPLPEVTVIDPYETARRVLKLARNNMDSVAFALGLQKQKTRVPWEIWQRAQFGDKKAMDTIVAYNVNDVEVLEELYLAIRPLIKNHPYVARPDESSGLDQTTQCPACGSYNSKKDGTRRTKSFLVFRRQCKACGTGFIERKRKIGP